MSETLRKYGAKYNTTFCSLCGLSTDTKPTGSFDGVGIANGSEFIEMDTGKKYMYDAKSSVWNEVSSGGGGGSTLIEKSITANGEYNASDDSADGYSKVTVDVANSYTQADEGKVVNNGALVAQTTHAEITENGIYDITTNNSVSVSVSAVSEYNGKFVSGKNFESVAKSLTEIIIPQGTTLLDNRAFNMCTNLVNVDLNNVKTLSSGCFRWCSSLASINLKSVEVIGDRIFESSGVTSIEIPNSVTSINQYAFTDSSINTITVHKPEGSISGAPWGATNATVIWDG